MISFFLKKKISNLKLIEKMISIDHMFYTDQILNFLTKKKTKFFYYA